MTAYYNEFDPYAAQWLRNLIKAGHIAPGEVDERSIIDVNPDDLAEFKQCHFFAGIGGWSLALRLAGWPDTAPVWTASCPCQPFSVAGMALGFADERHLWPIFHYFVEQRRPPVVFGEQVEAAIRHGWLDLVQSDMEGLGYAFAAAGIPAAGVGAPHIRQRLWFVAHDNHMQLESVPRCGFQTHAEHDIEPCRSAGRMGDDDDARLEGLGRGHQAESGRLGAIRPVAETGELGGLADDDSIAGNQGGAIHGGRHQGSDAQSRSRSGGCCGADVAGPVNNQWGGADWLFCRDGKWRPVEPGTFPLAHGVSNRVGRLRAYGNAIVPQVAAEVIRAFMECRP